MATLHAFTVASQFGQALKASRERAGLTQDEAVSLLKKAGIAISRRALSGYEMGENKPPDVKQDSILRIIQGAKLHNSESEQGADAVALSHAIISGDIESDDSCAYL